MEEKNKEVLGGQEINKTSIENVGNADQSEYKSVDEQLSALVKATPQLSTTPESYLGTVPFKGISRNVSPYAYTPGINEQEQMAWGQPTIEKIGLAFPRAATTALESIASIPGAVVGLGDWLAHDFDSDEFANAFSNGLLSAVSNTSEDAKERAFSIYTPEEVANGNLWRNLGSSSFWATQGADGVGFLLGAYLTGATPSLLGIGKGVTAGLSKVGVGRTIGQAANIADDVLSASAKSAKQMAKLAKPAAQISEKAGGMIDNLSAVALNTTYEATVEGMDIYNKLIGEGKTPEEASDAAAKTFKTNMVLLLPSNMWEQAMMFNSFKKGISAVEKKVLGKNRTTRLIDKVIDKAGIAAEAPAFTTVEKLKKFGRALGTGAVTEGFWEEGMQVLAQKMAAEGKSLTNIDDAITGYFDLMFGDDAESKEYWQSVFLGGLLGGGMSSIREASDIKKEQENVSKYHELIKDSWINRTKVLEDFAKKDDKGNVRYENGKIVLDPAKVIDGAKDYKDKVSELIQMSAAKELGYEELYNNIKTRLDLDFVSLLDLLSRNFLNNSKPPST